MTAAEPAALETIVDVVRRRARDQGEAPAFRFHDPDPRAEQRWSYAEVDRRARAVAARLRQVADQGERALLLHAPGPDFVASFLGALYAGVVAVPVYPPDPGSLQRSLPRFRAVTRAADVRVVLSSSQLAPMARQLVAMAPELAPLEWIHSDEVADAPPFEPRVGPSETAYIQFTSGSTSEPRGVPIEHGAVHHHLDILHGDLVRRERGREIRGVWWLPPYHDGGLIGGILQPLFSGFPMTLLSPLTFLRDPLRWLALIQEERATFSGGPNFAYDYCVRKIPPARRAGLDLSSWSLAFNSAEPIREESVEEFTAAFAACGFRRSAFFLAYGMAETTLLVTGAGIDEGRPFLHLRRDELARDRAVLASPSDPDAVSVAACGRALGDFAVAVVGPDGARLPDNAVGEIMVAGRSVARGYWGPGSAEAATSFGARLPGDDRVYYRTGDLGFMHEEQLYVTGRSKDLIILRGRNLYPQDLELTAERADEEVLRPGCAVAFSIDDDGREEKLILVIEVSERPS